MERRRLFVSVPVVAAALIIPVLLFYHCERFTPAHELYLYTDTITFLSNGSTVFNGAILNLGKDEIAQHGFCWSEQKDPTVDQDSSVSLGPRKEIGRFSATVTGLKGTTTYYVRTFATTPSGTEYSREKAFTTPALTIPSVTTSSVMNISEDSAYSGGVVVDAGTSPVTARGVCWDATVMPTVEDSHTTDGNGTGSFSSILSGLSCNTTYYVRAYATNSSGTAYGNQEVFATTECLVINLPAVTTALLSNITINSAECGGEVTDDGGGTIIARGLCWSTSQDPTLSDNYTDEGGGTGAFTCSITDLMKSTTYHVRAYATNSAGTAYGQDIILRSYEGTVVDFDGNQYWTTLIGSQIWMAENLYVTHYSNGTEIPLIETEMEWEVRGYDDEAYCWYDNNTINGDSYGALYTWSAAMNGSPSSNAIPSGIEGVCPDGWHLPSDAEWKAMEMSLGMDQSEADNTGWRGSGEGGLMKEPGDQHWTGSSFGASNASGFTAIPGGYRAGAGEFWNLGSDARFWTSEESDASSAWNRFLVFDQDAVGRFSELKDAGYSVRCVEGEGFALPTVHTDTVSGLTPTDANIECRVTDDGGLVVTARGICWSSVPNPTIADNTKSYGTGTGSFTADLSGLSVFTQYYVRSYATNNMGTVYGEEISFRTLWDGSNAYDIDDNAYPTTAIGDQIWLAKNLGVTRYADGSAIPLVEDQAEWTNLGSDGVAYCWYENNSANKNTYGALYTWAAAARSDSSRLNPSGLQGVCPDGWHLPSDEEWKDLEMALGMSQEDADLNGFRGKDEGSKLKEEGTAHWSTPNADATNESGFTAVGSGTRNFSGTFEFFGWISPLWSTTNFSDSGAWIRAIQVNEPKILRNPFTKSNGYAVRCVKDQ